MKKIVHRLFLAFLLFANAGPVSSQEKPYVVLVSFDGFRHDYVERWQPPNFLSFIRSGSSAEALIPSFPSKTFPNHYTIVTGLAPGHHGLVDNLFFDRESGKTYKMGDREMVENPKYYGGVPLWQLAQQNGMKSAAYFWVGSEVRVNGKHPDYYFRYNDAVPNEERIVQVVRWLQLPEKDRPRFIALYFSIVDTEGHNVGPYAESLRRTVLEADTLLGKLMSGIKSTGLPVNVVLVSDHGMIDIRRKKESWISLSDLFDVTSSSVVYMNNGTHTHLYTSNPDSLYAIIKPKEKNFRVLRKREYPKQWMFDHPRTGDLMIVADAPYYIQSARNYGSAMREGPVFGVHGFDPFSTPEMHGIFYASGPGIKPGQRIGRFQNIHIYPFIASLLGVTPPPTDADPSVLAPLLRK